MFDLSGKTALVTGSTQGIGFATASALAQHGAKVFVNGASSMEKCASASAKIPNSVPVLADLSDIRGVDALYEKTGDVDILVLNASVQIKNNWLNVSADEFDLQMTVNVKSSLMLMQKYIPHMKQQGFGRIVTIGSVNQYKQHPELAVYAATKSAQMNLVENLARQYACSGITVNNVSPGVIATPRNEQALSDDSYRRQVLAKIPCGYAGEAEDIAPAVLLLCSEEGRYITGIDLIADGGMHL